MNHRMPSSGRRPDARRHPKKKRRPGGSSIPYLLLTLAVLLIALTGIILVMNRRNSTVPLPETDAPDGTKAGTADVTGNSVPQTGEETRGGEETNGPLTYREVTILSAGDIMFHLPQVNSAYRPASGTYDFTDTADSLYAPDYLDTKNQYGFFLNDNHAFIEIHTGYNPGKTLFVIKDSYANSLIPLLTTHYENIYVVDLRYYNGKLFQLMEQYEPEQGMDVLVLYDCIHFLEDFKYY